MIDTISRRCAWGATLGKVTELAWFKVDDGLHSSRKVLSIPKRYRFQAMGLWALAGSWCADELTDGFVPDFMLKEWGATETVIQELVSAGLWVPTQGGYEFHAWLAYQPRKADVEAEREASKERMRAIRAARKQKKPQKDAENGEVFGRTGANGSENVRNPDPTRPDPTLTNTSKDVLERAPQKKATRLSEDWEPTTELIKWAGSKHPLVNLDDETFKFKNYWLAKSGKDATKLDWGRTWQNWIANSKPSNVTPINARSNNAHDFIRSLEAIENEAQ